MARLSPDDRQALNDANDLRTLTYTLLGEARGEGIEGMVAVANVIRNRTTSGLYSADPVAVVLQPWQFSTNNSPRHGGNQRQTRREVPEGSALYNQAQEIARRYILSDGIDLTGGSLFYHASGIDWRYADSATGPYGTTRIGNHTFYPRHPVPQVNVGDADLLAGYREPAPVPLPRTMRPGSTKAVSANSIAELQREMAVVRSLNAQRAANAKANRSMPLDVADQGIITPYLDDDGEVQTIIPMLQTTAPAERRLPVGGLGSLLGEAFPMVPSDLETVAHLPGEVRGPAAPGAGLTDQQKQAMRAVPQSSLRADEEADQIDEGALTTRIVRTVAIDPRTGSPILVTAGKGTTSPRPIFQTGMLGRSMAQPAPIPRPAEARPPSLAERVKPLTFPTLFVSEDHPKSNTPAARTPTLGTPPKVTLPKPTQTIDPKLRNAISAISAAPPSREVTTKLVRADGTTTTLPRAGEVQMPLTIPESVRPAAQPVGHGAPKKKAAPATKAGAVKPQTPLPPPTQTTDAAMRNAISAVPANAVQPPAGGAPQPAVVEEAPAPAPRPAPRRVSHRSVTVAPRPAPRPTFAGSSTGTRYTVGNIYLGSGARYAYEAQRNGTFKKIAKVDRTAQGQAIAAINAASTSPTYDVSGGNNAFNPKAIRESERQQTGY